MTLKFRLRDTLLCSALLLGLLLRNPAFAAAEIDAGRYAYILKTYVVCGRVDYRKLKENPAPLEAYLADLASVRAAEFKTWPESDQIAFWLNLYNASTLKLVTDHYPVKSIREIGNVFSDAWNREAVRVFGETKTLDWIEHGVLRKYYDEPRIHFALVHAARGGPLLRKEPYRGDALDEQLNDQRRQFMGIDEKNYWDGEKRELHLSPIFKWFRDDFAKETGLRDYVKPLFALEVRDQMTAHGGKVKIRFTRFDWALNEQTEGEAPEAPTGDPEPGYAHPRDEPQDLPA